MQFRRFLAELLPKNRSKSNLKPLPQHPNPEQKLVYGIRKSEKKTALTGKKGPNEAQYINKS